MSYTQVGKALSGVDRTTNDDREYVSLLWWEQLHQLWIHSVMSTWLPRPDLAISPLTPGQDNLGTWSQYLYRIYDTFSSVK